MGDLEIQQMRARSEAKSNQHALVKECAGVVLAASGSIGSVQLGLRDVYNFLTQQALIHFSLQPLNQPNERNLQVSHCVN